MKSFTSLLLFSATIFVVVLMVAGMVGMSV